MFRARYAVSLRTRKAGTVGGEIAEADPRRRRNDWLGFCQTHTAARLRKVGDEPQDERANPSAWRPAWERVRDLAPAVTGGVTAGTTPASL